ncbi:unnamed protein product [Rotaria sp. Silwood1]|nr:unnamed protein product [Rotaria sp. Silwood1]
MYVNSENKVQDHDRLDNNFLEEYLLNKYNIQCQIQLLDTQDIFLTLSGIKENIKVAREMITKLFESTRVKIYDEKDVDQQMIYWSKNIKSDLIIHVLQKIMDNENIFTIWEKTAMFSGYFKVLYFTHESFMVSEAKIAEILNNEIDYVENLTMPNEKTKQFLNNIDQFIFHRQHPELAIIRCTYPYKLDIKISLFGRQNLVHKAKKRLQAIINKNTMRIVQLRIPLHQQEYLLENCIEQLKDIEDEYKDDCVKIRIRKTEFSAPQYLIDKIHEKIKQLMIQPVIFQYMEIENSVQLTDDDIKKIRHIAEYNYCRIEKIDSKMEMKVYSIPKASSQLTNISSSIIQQSNEFISSLSMRKISVLNGSIEIYLTDQTRSIPRDVTIISSPQDAIEESIEYKNEYGYFEMKKTGKKFLFHRWSPTIADGDKTNKKLKSSIQTFISSTLQNITTCCTSARKIAFLANQWKHVGSQSQQQSLAHNLINEIKQEIEARKINWSILFIFNKENIDLYKEFHQVLVQYQTDQDGFAQFCSTLRHTKPGITGKIYSETAILPKIPQTNEEHSNTNDAGFVTDQLSNDASFEHDSMSFNHSVSEAYFSPFNSNPGSCFNNEESSNYFYRLIRSTRPINHMQTTMEDNDTAWDIVSLLQEHTNPDEDEIDDEWKTPEEIRKLEELDNPNRIWKNTRNAEKFIQQKLKNILEFKELCEKSS